MYISVEYQSLVIMIALPVHHLAKKLLLTVIIFFQSCLRKAHQRTPCIISNNTIKVIFVTECQHLIGAFTDILKSILFCQLRFGFYFLLPGIFNAGIINTVNRTSSFLAYFDHFCLYFGTYFRIIQTNEINAVRYDGQTFSLLAGRSLRVLERNKSDLMFFRLISVQILQIVSIQLRILLFKCRSIQLETFHICPITT